MEDHGNRETFKGINKMLELANRSVAAGDHGSGEGLLPFKVFTNAEGTKLIWEFRSTLYMNKRFISFA
jgi:hypothetical protein